MSFSGKSPGLEVNRSDLCHGGHNKLVGVITIQCDLDVTYIILCLSCLFLFLRLLLPRLECNGAISNC